MKPGIVFFCPSFSTGGAEKVLINLANEFRFKGYKTSFLVCQRIGELDTLLEPGIQVHSFNKRLAACIQPLYRFLRSEQPDVIICGPQFISILTVLVSKVLLRNKTRIILTHHNFFDLDVRKVPLMDVFNRSLLKYFYKKSDAIVAVSHAVKKHLVNDIGIPKSKVVVIYNPVLDRNFDVFKRADVSHKWYRSDRTYKILICVGRLSKVKNQEELIRLMPDLIRKLDCRLVLLGEGEQHVFLKNLISELDLEEFVDLVGAVINPIKYIYHSDLLVLPSITETFSLVGVESIASGTPVLSTPTEGVMEILESCKGCYFELIQNKNGFIEMILHALSQPASDVDVRFAERFTVENITMEYENLVKEVYG